MKAKLVHFKIHNKYQNPFPLYKFCPFRYFAVVPVFLVVLVNIGTLLFLAERLFQNVQNYI